MELTPITKLIREDGTVSHSAGIGGYSIVFLGDMDDVLCDDCVNGWTVEGILENVKGGFIHWEGEPLTCDGCDCELESEYGDPYEDEEEDEDEAEDIAKSQQDMIELRKAHIRKEAPWILG